MATRVLITGADGLIGRYAVEACRSADLEPVLLDRHLDLLLPGHPSQAVEDAGVAVVVHLAWSASGTPGYRQSRDNARWVESSIELYEACERLDVRFVGTGTVLDCSDPSDSYTRSKVALRHRLAAPIAEGGVCWLRPHYVFDPDRGRPGLVLDALRARAASVPLELSHPARAHDFVHARDVGAAVATAVRHDLTGVVDVGSGRYRTVASLVERLGVEWRQSTVEGPPVQHDDDAADTGRLGGLGWVPRATEEFFDDG